MAINPQLQQQGQSFRGIQTSGMLPAELVKSDDLSRLGKIAYIHRDQNPFPALLHQKMGKGKTISGSREHKVIQFTDIDRMLTVSIGSSTPAGGRPHSVFGIPNAQAISLRPGSVLYNCSKFTALVVNGLIAGQVNPSAPFAHAINIRPLGWSTGGQASAVVFSKTWGYDPVNSAYVTSPEQMVVLNVGAPDSAGSGNTSITVSRVHQGPGAMDRGGSLIDFTVVDTSIANAGDSAVIDAGDVIAYGHPTDWEGGGAPNGFFKQVEIDNNFTQEMKWAVEITEESEIENLWISEKPMDLNRYMVSRLQMRQYEKALWWNKKTNEMDAQGNRRIIFGGIEEFILKDAEHILKFNNSTLTWANWLWYSRGITELGGSQEKWLFCGTSLLAKLRMAFADRSDLHTNLTDSKNYNIEITKLYGAGVALNIVASQELEESNYRMKGFCLDLDNSSFVPVNQSGWDMKVEKDIGPKDKQVYKEQVITIKGLERRNQQYQCILDFEGVA